MKRDMDLIRNILLEVESADDLPVLRQREIEEQYIHHLLLVQEAQLISGVVVTVCDGGEMLPDIVGKIRLTWAGHEFLDAARSDTVWKAVKDRVGSAVGTVSFTVLTQLLIEATKRQLGMAP